MVSIVLILGFITVSMFYSPIEIADEIFIMIGFKTEEDCPITFFIRMALIYV